jgi:hypothetical protein
MEDVCNGLIFIHDEKGLVHLDIKPENVCDHLLVLRTVRSLSSNRGSHYSRCVGLVTLPLHLDLAHGRRTSKVGRL